jgi:O-antigen/teichoic acid export membrane protein
VWIILPSVEALIVPEAFRGPFAHFLTLLLPGLFLFSFGQFAVNAIFQIARKTLPMVFSALAACVANLGFALLLPRGDDASSLAVAQSLAMGVGLVALLGFAQLNAPQWPRVRDIALSIAGCALMAALAAPLRACPPGFGLMLGQITLGGASYALVVAVFDVAGLRTAARRTIAPHAARLSEKGGLFKYLRPLGDG